MNANLWPVGHFAFAVRERLRMAPIQVDMSNLMGPAQAQVSLAKIHHVLKQTWLVLKVSKEWKYSLTNIDTVMDVWFGTLQCDF